ncbi:hypothetical protein [Streptomyces sp. NPDC058572]|uniref:hypothetical protein n=1 Tax=Streptomyces sp. NPDC058572 TaxID=3346546 RepID=UPI003668F4C5
MYSGVKVRRFGFAAGFVPGVFWLVMRGGRFWRIFEPDGLHAREAEQTGVRVNGSTHAKVRGWGESRENRRPQSSLDDTAHL